MNTISDSLAARLRTLWPMLLGYLAAQLLVWAAPVTGWVRDVLDVDITEQQVAALLGLVLGWLLYELGRWLEGRPGDGWPARIARAAGRWLLALGLHTGQPTYGTPFTSQSKYLYGPDGRVASVTSTTVYAGGGEAQASRTGPSEGL